MDHSHDHLVKLVSAPVMLFAKFLARLVTVFCVCVLVRLDATCAQEHSGEAPAMEKWSIPGAPYRPPGIAALAHGLFDLLSADTAMLAHRFNCFGADVYSRADTLELPEMSKMADVILECVRVKEQVEVRRICEAERDDADASHLGLLFGVPRPPNEHAPTWQEFEWANARNGEALIRLLQYRWRSLHSERYAALLSGLDEGNAKQLPAPEFCAYRYYIHVSTIERRRILDLMRLVADEQGGLADKASDDLARDKTLGLTIRELVVGFVPTCRIHKPLNFDHDDMVTFSHVSLLMRLGRKEDALAFVDGCNSVEWRDHFLAEIAAN